MSDIKDDELDYLNKHEMSRRDFMLDMMAMGGLAAGLMAAAALVGMITLISFFI